MSLRVLSEIEAAVEALRASDRLFIKNVKIDLDTQLEQFMNMFHAADCALIGKMRAFGFTKIEKKKIFFERDMQSRDVDINEVRVHALKVADDIITSAVNQVTAHRKKIFESLKAKDDMIIAVITTGDALFADMITRRMIHWARQSEDFSPSTFLEDAVEKRDETRQVGLQARRMNGSARRRLILHTEETASVNILKKIENDSMFAFSLTAIYSSAPVD